MISMKNWQVYVSAKDSFIGHEKDNLLRTLEIETDLPAGWAVTLELKKDGAANSVSLDYADGTLSVSLKEEMLADCGVYDAQLKGVCGEITAHSNHFSLEVGESINAFGSFPPLTPTAMEQLERQLLNIKADTESAKAVAEASAAAAEEDRQTVSSMTAQAVEAARSAEAAKEAFENAQLKAKTLPAGSEATAEKETSGGNTVITLGIPQGKQGMQGPAGPQGIQGPEGPRGIGGVAAAVEGFIAFNVDDNGHLIVDYTGDEAPDMSIDENGHLILNF